MRTNRFSRGISRFTNLFIVTILGLNAVLTPASVVVAAPVEAPLAESFTKSALTNTTFAGPGKNPVVRSPIDWQQIEAQLPRAAVTLPDKQQSYLKASTIETGDWFGWSMAIDQETQAIGAPMEDSNSAGGESNNSAGESGATYIFTRNGATWNQQAYLKASNTESGDQFGYSVAISGDTVVVGAPYEASNGTSESDNSAASAGAVYVFTRSGTNWSQQAYLKASNVGINDEFGNSVAISGDTVVVGAWSEDSSAGGGENDNSATDAGAAYVFTRSGTTWSQQAYLKASNAQGDDWFGASVTIDGDTLVVGAQMEESNGTSESDNSTAGAGAAYVFTRNGTTWSQQAYLKAYNAGEQDEFGYPLALDGETLVAGAFGEASNGSGESDNSAFRAGAAYVFTRNGTTWNQQAYLKASNAEANDQFGWSVGIRGDTVVVGAWAEDSSAGGGESDNSATNAGAAYIFTRDGTIWSQGAYLKASNAESGDAFGDSVAISEDTVVFGASGEASNGTSESDNSADSAGAAYVFSSTGSISGTVFESDGITPIANMVVSLDGPGFGNGTCTDTSGAYSFDSVAYGVDWRVRAAPSGDNWCGGSEAYAEEYWQETTSWNNATTLLLSESTPSYTDINFTLDPGGSISGHIYEADGITPIANARVEVNIYSVNEAVKDTYTDGQGYYIIDGLPPRDDYKIEVDATNYLRTFYQNVARWDDAAVISVLSGQTTSNIDVHLINADSYITGRVAFEDNSPASNVKLNAFHQDGWFIANNFADEDGNYIIPVIAGTWQVTPYQPPFVSAQQDVVVNTGETISNIDFVLQSGGSISGTIRDSENSPIQNVQVCAHDYDTDSNGNCELSDANGNYTLTPLLAGDYRVQARVSGWAREYYNETYNRNEATRVAVVGGATTPDINFELEPGGSISGVVYESDGVTPVANIVVSLDGPGFGDGTCTDQNGYYNLDRIPYGIAWRVRAAPSGDNWCGGSDGYPEMYWQNVYSWDDATPITLDAGNAIVTGINFSLLPLQPIIFALINENQVHGYNGWPGESTVTLTVDDPGDGPGADFTADQIAVNNAPLIFNLPFETQLAPGFELSMSDGTTTRNLTIANLTVNIDLTSDTLSGTAEPNAELWVDVWQGDNQRHIFADGSGNWIADFSTPGDEDFEQNVTDLQTGFDGEVYTPDADGDYTAFKWEAAWIAPPEIPLVVGVNGWIDLSPLGFDYDSWTVASLLWEPLLRVAEDGSLSYAAAESYAVSPDGLTYTFTLRPDGSWSDSQPVTAQNFVDGFLRILDPNAGYDYAYLLYPIAGAEDYNTGVASDPNTVGLAALNATTLQITLHSPAVFFPQVVATPGMVPIRQDLFDLYGNDWVWPGTIESSGPYLYTTTDRGYDILERNPDYRDAGQVAYSKIAFARYLNPYELVQAYKDGEVDAILQAPERQTVHDPALALDRITSSGAAVRFIQLNTLNTETNNLLVRKALASAIDRRYLLDVVLETPWRIDAQGVIPPGLLGYQADSVGYSYNPSQAQQYLADAGFPNGAGFPELVLVVHENSREIMQEVASQWQNVLNIQVRIEYYSDGYGSIRGECGSDPANCAYSGYPLGWLVDYFDSNNILNDLFYPVPPPHWVGLGWDNVEYRNKVDASRMEPNQSLRIQYLQDAEQILVETDVAVIPLIYMDSLHLINSDIYPAFGAMIPYLDQWGNSDVDGDGIHDLIDPCPEDDTNSCNPDGSASEVVGSGGGTVTTENNNVNMDIPPGAVTNETTFTITDQGKGYMVSTDQGPIEAITSVEIGPGGTTFAVPVPLTFSWPDADNDDIVDGTSYAETALQLSKDGIVIATCSDLPGPCDFASNTITVEVSSLSIFVVGAANFSETLTPLIPSGTLTDWDHTFSWDGLSNATWYLLEVQTSAGTQVFRKWYTSTQSGCTGGTACSVTQADLSLANGDYKWRVMDYGAYGYGTNTAFLNFTLNVACRTLATAVNPVGSGTVNASAQNCTGGYTDGTLVQLTAVPNAGYLFSSWSGFASGTSNPVSVTMDGDKSVTANFEATLNPLSPSGTLTSWDSSFSWTGLDNATWYLIEVQTSGGTQVFRQWYTSAQSGCSGGTACSVTQSDLILANGDYKWRVMDYGAYGYGSNSAFRNFTLNLTCYSLTTNLNPAGSGVINTSAQNCAGGYNPGSIVQLSVVPGTGYVFSNWSGDASGKSNPVTVTMNADRNVTANMRGNTPLIPSGPLTSWSKAFSWTGPSDATWYLLEVQTSTGTQVFRQWYTSAQTGCSGGTACSITPAGLNLANGDYKWRILDYGAYGYGLNSAFKNFTLDLACFTLAVDVNPAGKGTVTVPGQSCAGGYTSGSILQLTAIHGTDYLFSNWSGDASGSNNPLSLTMTGNKNITANFTVIPTSSANLFTPYVNHPVERPSTVGVGDFNQDGLLDAAVTNDAAELKIFYQNQSGSLGNETTYAAGPRPEGLAVGDLNHDGRDDIVVTNVTSNTISVFLQLADGSLAGRETYSTGTGPDAVAVGDVNGDGLDDVAVSNWNSAYISVFTQNIDGSLNVRVDYPSQQAGYDDIAIGDVNNDGLNDIVKMNGQGLNDNLLVYIQNINNTFDAYIPYSLVGCTSFCLANGIGIGDVTGDGRADVVMSYGGNRPNAYVAVFSQAADGSLGEAVSYSAYDIPEALEVADVNDDGKTDVVTVHGGWNAISVYTQQLDGTLGSYSTYPLRTNSASHYKPQALTIRDVNQDGLPDALLANSNYGLDILYHVPPDEVTPLTPAGSLSEWNNTFRWVGLPDATWYLLEVQTSGGTQVFRQWYTSTQTGCSGGTACSVAPTGLSLANGDYKWRILDYGAYGYGIWTSYMEFTLNQ